MTGPAWCAARQVAEGLDTLTKINEAFVDPDNMPWQVIRIKHTIVLEDPFEDMAGLAELIPPTSPRPPRFTPRPARVGLVSGSSERSRRGRRR